MTYRPEIDGLRAFAVVPVILFHAGIPHVGGGFVGVDVFFVISGFLITSILIAEFQKGNFSIVRFYERRARRILPALFLVVLSTMIACWFILQPTDMKDFCHSIISTVFFYSNLLFLSEQNYWAAASELKPLLHTWSLSVEEQYYIFFPIFLMFLWRFGVKSVVSIIAIGAVVSLILAHWCVSRYPSAAFFILPTRAWELALGAGAAFFIRRQDSILGGFFGRRSVEEALGAVGLAMILYATFFYSRATPFPSLYALVPTVGTTLVILFAKGHTLSGKLLSLKLFVGIGLISYSLYLWHQPIFALARIRIYPEPEMKVFLVLTGLVVILSILSWKYVENPFRNKTAFSSKKIFSLSLVGSLFLVTLAIGGVVSNGFANRAWYQELLVRDYQPDNRLLQMQSWTPLKELSGDANYDVVGNDFDNVLWFDESDSRKKMLVVGNSHSKDIFNLLKHSEVTEKNFQVARYGTQIKSVGRFFDSPNLQMADVVLVASMYDERDNKKLRSFVEKLVAFEKKVVLVRTVDRLFYHGNKTLADQMMSEAFQEGKLEDLNDATSLVQEINSAYYSEVKAQSRKGHRLESDQIIASLAEEFEHVISLDRMDYIIDEENRIFHMMNEQFTKMFYDHGHHSLEGAKFFANRVDEIHWLSPVLDWPEKIQGQMH